MSEGSFIFILFDHVKNPFQEAIGKEGFNLKTKRNTDTVHWLILILELEFDHLFSFPGQHWQITLKSGCRRFFAHVEVRSFHVHSDKY